MAWGWVLFIKILLILLALRPASVPLAGGKAGQPGRLSTSAPSVVRDKGPQLPLQQGYGEHERAPQQQPQRLQQRVEPGQRRGRTEQGWELKGEDVGVRRAPASRTPPCPRLRARISDAGEPGSAPAPPRSRRLQCPPPSVSQLPPPPLTMSTRAT